MVVRVATVAFEGIEARPVDVQVQISSGNVVFTIVGLADKAVGESRERVRCGAGRLRSGAAGQAHHRQSRARPTCRRKAAITICRSRSAVMAAIGALPADALGGFTVLGELALDGSLTPVAGVLPAAVAANARGHGLICPARLRAGGRLGRRAIWR